MDELLAACRAEPFEDLPRLVLADWLQDNGDEAWATLIRYQCSLPRVDPLDYAWVSSTMERVGEFDWRRRPGRADPIGSAAVLEVDPTERRLWNLTEVGKVFGSYPPLATFRKLPRGIHQCVQVVDRGLPAAVLFRRGLPPHGTAASYWWEHERKRWPVTHVWRGGSYSLDGRWEKIHSETS